MAVPTNNVIAFCKTFEILRKKIYYCLILVSIISGFPWLPNPLGSDMCVVLFLSRPILY